MRAPRLRKLVKNIFYIIDNIDSGLIRRDCAFSGCLARIKGIWCYSNILTEDWPLWKRWGKTHKCAERIAYVDQRCRTYAVQQVSFFVVQHWNWSPLCESILPQFRVRRTIFPHWMQFFALTIFVTAYEFLVVPPDSGSCFTHSFFIRKIALLLMAMC